MPVCLPGRVLVLRAREGREPSAKSKWCVWAGVFLSALISQAVQETSVLTVGEMADFLAMGGAIALLAQQDALPSKVNLESKNEAHRKLSSNSEALARRVVNKPSEPRN